MTASSGHARSTARSAEGNAASGVAEPAPAARDSGVLSLQRSAGNAVVTGVIPGSGQRVEPSLRQEMEERFGESFGDVRLHTDAHAADSAATLHAKAYTVGRDIVFSEGRYAPQSNSGKRLIAHELAHVVQQSRGGGPASLAPSGPLEHSAKNAESAYGQSQGQISVQGRSAAGVARDEEDDPQRKPPPQLASGLIPPSHQLSPGPVTVEQVMSDPEAVKRFHDVGASAAKNVKDLSNVQGAIFEEVMNREIARRVASGNDLGELLPQQLDRSKVQIVATPKDLANLKPGQAAFIEGSRIKAIVPKEKGDKEGAANLSDGMILLRQKDGSFRVLSVFEAKSGAGRAYELHRGEDKETPTKSDLKEQKKVAKDPETAKLIKTPFGGQIRRDVERLAPNVDTDVTEILVDGKRVAVRSSPRSTRFVGVVPQDVDVHSAVETLAGKPKDGGRGINFGVMKVQSSEADVKVAASRVVEKAQADKPWPMGDGEKKKKDATPTGESSPPVAKPKKKSAADSATKQAKAAAKKTPAPKKTQSPNEIPPAKKDAAASTLPAPQSMVKPKKASASKPKASAKTTTSGAAKPKSKAKVKTPAAAAPTMTSAAATPATPRPAQPKKTAAKPKAPTTGTGAVRPVATTSGSVTKIAATAAKPQSATGAGATAKGAVPPRSPTNKATGGSTIAAPGTPPGSRETEVQRGAHGVTGPGQLGAAGSAGVKATQTHAEGLQTHQSVGFDGQVSIQAKPEPGTSPSQYRVTLHIQVGGHVGAGASREGRAGGGASVGAAGSFTAVFSHLLSAEDTARYVDSATQGRGGAEAELQVVQLIREKRLDEARDFLAQINAQRGSPEASRQMKEGDRSDISLEGSASAQVDASGSRGGGKAGISVGASGGKAIQRSESMEQGKHHITLHISGQQGYSAGASASSAYAGGGYDYERGTSDSQTVGFVLDPKSSTYAADLQQISALHSIEDLNTLKARRPDLVTGASTGHGTSKGGTVHASALGVDLGITEKHQLTEEQGDPKLGTPYSIEGSGTGGASLSLGGHKVAEHLQTDTFRGVVSADNKGSGEARKDTDEIDLGQTLSNAAKHPLAALTGAATGGQVLQRKAHSEGTALSDDSYSRFAELAKDESEWSHAWSGDYTGNLYAWNALRPKILAAYGDRQQIAKAMAQYENEGTGRSATVQNAVGGTGINFEFPNDLADQKPLFDRLVVGDPVAEARGAGDEQATVDQLKAASQQLEALADALRNKPEAFERPAALTEMLQRIRERNQSVRAEISRITHPPQTDSGGRSGATPSKKGDASPKSARTADAQAAVDPAAADALAAREGAENRARDIEVLIKDLTANKRLEQSVFRSMEAELDRWFLGPDIRKLLDQESRLRPAYHKWDSDVTKLRQLIQESGGDPNRVTPLAPDREHYLELDGKIPGRGYGSGLPGYKET